MPEQNLSTATLFHFTPSLQNLVGIFRDGLRPAFSVEDFAPLVAQQPTDTNQVAIPMASFCDIPLSQTRPHMERYGSYAIGMSKSWGISVGIAPVLYILGGGATARALGEILIELATQNATDTPSPMIPFVERLLCFTKPYAGISSTSGSEIRFYDEREWRFVPQQPDGTVSTFARNDFNRLVEEENRTRPVFEGPGMILPVAEVRFIVVKEDSEILPVMDVLQDIGGSRFTVNESRLLQSRIISSAQVAEDF